MASLESDIIFALALMVFISLIVFLFACFLCRKLGIKTRTWLVGIVIVLTILFRVYYFDSTLILKLLPFDNTIIYGNFTVPLAAIACGIFYYSRNIPLWRRLILIVFIMAMAIRPTFLQLVAEKPETHNIWKDGVCLQSTNSTCGAASAATLLNYYAIEASENEMVEKCLTSSNGSFKHGIYRGLRKKINDTGFVVEAGSCSLSQLQNEVKLPAVIIVKLTKEISIKEPRYSQVWGWRVDVPHVILVTDFTENAKVLVADPARGREVWDIEGLKDLWQGEYITLDYFQAD